MVSERMDVERLAVGLPMSLRVRLSDPALLDLLRRAELAPMGGSQVRVGNELLNIPYRIYNDAPPATALDPLEPAQRRVLAALFTRHHDGRVRQASLETLLSDDATWIVPYVVVLLGEYVVEIADVVDRRLPTDDVGRQRFVRFVADNPDLMRRVSARAVSYWNCYYRLTYPERSTYPAIAALIEIDSWSSHSVYGLE